jgi:conjugal transfer/entry exclusion protein
VRAAVLEARLARLEGALGASGAAAAPDAVPLCDRLRRMEETLAVAGSAAEVHAVQRRAQAASVHLENLQLVASRAAGGGEAGAASAAADPLRAEAARKAMDALQAAEPLLAELPAIVERMRTLRALHEEGARFATRISAVEAEQRELAEKLAAGRRVLEAVEKGFEENATAVAENVRALEARLKN